MPTTPVGEILASPTTVVVPIAPVPAKPVSDKLEFAVIDTVPTALVPATPKTPTSPSPVIATDQLLQLLQEKLLHRSTCQRSRL